MRILRSLLLVAGLLPPAPHRPACQRPDDRDYRDARATPDSRAVHETTGPARSRDLMRPHRSSTISSAARHSPRTRNARLAALHSFMRYASLRDPSALAVAQRVLAIPTKRFDRPVLGYLSREEMEALLAAPDSCTWSGRRDAVLFAVLYNSGARVSEITGVCVADVLLDREVAVRLHGNPCHAYCISFRRRDNTTGKPACRQACDLASSAADVGWVVRRGIGIGPCTGEHGAGRAGPMSEPFPG